MVSKFNYYSVAKAKHGIKTLHVMTPCSLLEVFGLKILIIMLRNTPILITNEEINNNSFVLGLKLGLSDCSIIPHRAGKMGLYHHFICIIEHC
jgi:hypothetical protein